MSSNIEYPNSVNLNINTGFPYLVLNVENDLAYPLNSGFRIMHWHEDLQFIYVIDGKISVKTLDNEILISAGNGIFINKNVVHMIKKIIPCKYKSFIFPDYFVSFYIGSPAYIHTKSITDNSDISTVTLSSEINWSRKILDILIELINIEKNKSEFYCYEVLSKLSCLWLILLKNISVSKQNTSDAAIKRTKQFLRYIEEHYSDNISLEDLAKSANVSKSECLRCFKLSLQTTPYKYLMDYRLQKATAMLKTTDLSVNEISFMTGFNQQSYFGKCFKAKLGCSPLQYRNKQ